MFLSNRSSRVAALLAIAGTGLFGQSNFGSITGVVRDTSGGAIPAATVKVTDIGTNAVFTATSDASGVYSVPSLRPVTYEVSATAKGFQTTTVKDVKIDTSRTFAVDIVLKPGSISEVVNVTSDAPLLEAASGAVSQTVNARQMEDMPALVALARHLAGDEILDVVLVAQAHGDVALIGALRHEMRQSLPVAGFDLAQDEGSRVYRGKYGGNRHSAASYFICRPLIQPSRNWWNQSPSTLS